MDISYPVSQHQSFKLKNLNPTSDIYYKTYGKLIEHMKLNLITKEETSTGIEIHQDQITKRIVKRKQEYEDDTKNSRKLPATGIPALRIFRELPTMNQTRKRTYSHWRLKLPTRSQMIESGFFSCNVGDRVICIYCNVICQQWIATDDPSEIHKLLSPDCSFVKSNLVSPISSTRAVLNETSNVAANVEIVLTQACNQQFVGIPQRQASYATWPQDIPLPSVDDIVRAGFFYSGKKTIVTCFYCNGSLQNWAEKDNPMIEHARWFPQCPYARQLCGNDLYQKIQQSERIAQQGTLASPSVFFYIALVFIHVV
ncbi:unnamed protein product [Didymodactylos carnosus]|uniref:Inhibitor of apoptosis 2 n=1 Tax=Didymodactylos carnosus TaxID=1234261 RepID=A0A8S2FML1_9BILA|nr:unnamed protein product [Didymodactylos carnosus]CAF4287721.1 unnamed protein product [Didymodactylos carnosus]